MSHEYLYNPSDIPFVEDGFSTGFIVLPGLKLGLQLPPNRYFKFDGIVPEMWSYLRSLPPGMKEYIRKYIGDYRFSTAFNMGFEWFDYVGMFMTVKEVSPRVDLSNLAHESAEIAFRFGFINQLETHLTVLGLRKSLHGLTQHQVGVLAGILVPESQGYSIRKLIEDQDSSTYTSLVSMGLL